MLASSHSPVAALDPSAGEVELVFLAPNRRNPCRLTVSQGFHTKDLYVSNIPSYFPVSEFVQICEPYLDRIASMRVVGVPKVDSFGMLLRCWDLESAELLYSEIHQVHVSIMANEFLFVSFFQRITADFCSAEELHALLETPLLQFANASAVAGLPDGSPVTPSATAATGNSPDTKLAPLPPPASTSAATAQAPGSFASGSEDTSRNSPLVGPAPPPFPGASPNDPRAGNCSVCLDRLGLEPLMFTVCGHLFHVNCYANIQDENCPLCRHNPRLEQGYTRCQVCGVGNDLWHCLICGVVRCGRYAAGHAQKHAAESRHALASQLGGYRVWDFSRDQFLHRLVATEDTGFVDSTKTALGTTQWWAIGDEEEAEVEKEKLEARTEFISSYYSSVLENQLQQQHDYYEGLMAHLTAPNSAPGAFVAIPASYHDRFGNGSGTSSGAPAAALNPLQSTLAHLARNELRGRQQLTHHAVEVYRHMCVDFERGVRDIIRHHTKKLDLVEKEIEVVNATLGSLREGRAKCEQMLLNDPAKDDKKLKPLFDRVAALEQELEHLYLQFQ
jgi:hypothetical protein